ncbi:unnamed protein product [Owenia fusiformis]|uniref:Uncharacterized protein n=1 Tax=Owenia fusiformis TaxID=6347 RepID=A0A8S4P6T5_OWEFU|nr:unnamed protein product [Owenia fusiformis]
MSQPSDEDLLHYEQVLNLLTEGPRSEVVEQLLHDGSEEEFDTIREYFFEKAKIKVTEHCNSIFGPLAEREENEVPVNLQPKKRQGKNKLTNTVMDICDLYLYITDNLDMFPKGVLSTNSFLPEATMSREACNNMHRNDRAASMDVTITLLTQRVKELEDEKGLMKKDIGVLTSKLEEMTVTCKTLQSDFSKMAQNLNSTLENLASTADLANPNSTIKQNQKAMANFAKSSLAVLSGVSCSNLSKPNDPNVPVIDRSNNVNNNNRNSNIGIPIDRPQTPNLAPGSDGYPKLDKDDPAPNPNADTANADANTQLESTKRTLTPAERHDALIPDNPPDTDTSHTKEDDAPETPKNESWSEYAFGRWVISG